MGLKLTFQIELKSDYHISAGHGGGAGVDSALQRDADHAPVIRGTTLTGLLRDGLWRLLESKSLQAYRLCQASRQFNDNANEYCGQFDNTPREPCPACRLFGAPNQPKRWRIASARPSWQNDDAYFMDSQVEQHVRIDPRTRRAEPRKLFSQEVGTDKQTFTFTATCPVNNKSALDEAALLTAVARNVRLLGRSRRRGQGECRFKLMEVEGAEEIKPDPDWQSAFLKRFGNVWLKGEPASLAEGITTLTASKSAEEKGEKFRIRLIIRTDEPILISQRAESGNQFKSLPYINGQTLLGALGWRAARRYDLQDKPTYKAFLQLFRRGGIQFSNLYPAELKTNLYPTIPTPHDLYTCKLVPGNPPHGHGMRLTTQNPIITCQKNECDSPLRRVKGFVKLKAWEGNQDHQYEVSHTTEMHIRMDPKSGRVVEGDLYGYVVLDPGQYFVGDLICQNQGAWDTFSQLTGLSLEESETIWIGRASRRGYGKVSAWFEKITLEEDIWARQPQNGTVKEIQLTLLTDTIIQDTWGRYVTGFKPGWLKGELGLDVKEKGIRAAASTRHIDGFNGLFQLPRWRDIALTAGSTAHLLLEKPIDLESLTQFTSKGIGLRQEEGFGQIAINHPVYTQYIQGEGRSVSINMATKEELHRADYKLPHWERNWRKILDRSKWQTCKDPCFTAVARWLHSNRDLSPKKLAGEITELGEPSKSLFQWIGEQEYGDRHKANRLQSHNKGIELIQNLLLQLEDIDGSHPVGIEMLADRVAVAAKKEEN